MVATNLPSNVSYASIKARGPATFTEEYPFIQYDPSRIPLKAKIVARHVFTQEYRRKNKRSTKGLPTNSIDWNEFVLSSEHLGTVFRDDHSIDMCGVCLVAHKSLVAGFVYQSYIDRKLQDNPLPFEDIVEKIKEKLRNHRDRKSNKRKRGDQNQVQQAHVTIQQQETNASASPEDLQAATQKAELAAQKAELAAQQAELAAQQAQASSSDTSFHSLSSINPYM